MFNACIHPGKILLPDEKILPGWACVACDQFTSQPEYWQKVKQITANQPSTYNLILPECDLSQSGERVPLIHQTMENYLEEGIFRTAVENGMILTERTTASGTRLGLVALLDLETYDYHKGNACPVRATEETIESRIPARVAIRRNAALELSHVLMLIDDPAFTLLTPLHEKRNDLRRLYDFTLMQDGGQAKGYALESREDLQFVNDRLKALWQASGNETPLLFAVGDGNHSLASAKACWEEIKPALSEKEQESHPARFALVEVENIHDPAIRFEAIHRVIFGAGMDEMLKDWKIWCGKNGVINTEKQDAKQEILWIGSEEEKNVRISESPWALAVGTLQAFLDAWLMDHPEAKIDYIHGADALRSLCKQKDAVGFLLPKPDGHGLFESVIQNGALPRKTFSMGHANEKRYYLEVRTLKRG